MKRILPVALFALTFGTALCAQGQGVTAKAMKEKSLGVTVVGESTVVVSEAKIYIPTTFRGGTPFDVEMTGLLVTDALVPPEGINITPTLVEWEKLKTVEFLNWLVREGDRRFVKARLTLASGSTRDVFVWDRSGYPLDPQIKIKGRTKLQGTEQDVSVGFGGSLKSLEFGNSK